jgi:hypothetical protein
MAKAKPTEPKPAKTPPAPLPPMIVPTPPPTLSLVPGKTPLHHSRWWEVRMRWLEERDQVLLLSLLEQGPMALAYHLAGAVLEAWRVQHRETERGLYEDQVMELTTYAIAPTDEEMQEVTGVRRQKLKELVKDFERRMETEPAEGGIPPVYVNAGQKAETSQAEGGEPTTASGPTTP